jgi:YVTN family beta-propeller protein
MGSNEKMRLRIGLALTLFACAPIEASAQSGTLLIGNKGENTLSFVDLATGNELGRAPTGRMPHEIAVSPDGRQAAVVAYGGTTIDIFDVATRTRLRTIELAPNAGPHGIAWLEDGRILATTERSQSLAIIDTRNGDRVSAIPTGQQGTHMVAVSPDRRRAFTANIGSGTVSVLDLAGGAKLRDIAVGGQPEGIALSPDGGTLWVGDLQGARVQAFDTQSFERLAEVRTGAVPIRSRRARTDAGSSPPISAAAASPSSTRARARACARSRSAAATPAAR